MSERTPAKALIRLSRRPTSRSRERHAKESPLVAPSSMSLWLAPNCMCPNPTGNHGHSARLPRCSSSALSRKNRTAHQRVWRGLQRLRHHGWCSHGEPDQSERCAAADHHGPSMYTSGWRRMQQPQFAWQLPYPCGYGGVACRCRSAMSGIDRQQAQSRWHPRVFPIAVSVALCSSVTPAPALRSGLPQMLSPPPPANDFSRVS